MSRVLLCSALLASLVAGAALAGDEGAKRTPQEKPAAVKATPPERLVYHVKNVPAVALAKTVTEFLKDEAAAQSGPAAGTPHGIHVQRVVIVPDAVSNNLLVSGPPSELEQLAEVIKQLDAAPPMVRVDVLIAEVACDDASLMNAEALSAKFAGKSLDAVAAELAKLGKLRMMVRPSVTTLSNQAAFIQGGERKPRITGRTSSSRGQVNSVSLENVGIIVGVTPRVNTEGLVTMEIDVERSYLGPAEEGTPIATSPSGDVVRTPTTMTTQSQTTVSAESDQTIMLGGMITQVDGETPSVKAKLMFAKPHVFRATKE